MATKELKISDGQRAKIVALQTQLKQAEAQRNTYLEGVLDGHLSEKDIKRVQGFDLKDKALVVTLADA